CAAAGGPARSLPGFARGQSHRQRRAGTDRAGRLAERARSIEPGNCRARATRTQEGRAPALAVLILEAPSRTEWLNAHSCVMAGLVPAIHVFDAALKTWMPAPSAGMTMFWCYYSTLPGLRMPWGSSARLSVRMRS